MRGAEFLWTMWHYAENWRLAAALIGGIVVGIVYFYSLRWSVNHLSESKHRWRMFVGTALLRIALFFGVLVLIANRNVAVILIYLAGFFVTRMIIVGREKGFLKEKQQEHD